MEANYRKTGNQTMHTLKNLLESSTSQLKQSKMKSTENLKVAEVTAEDLSPTGRLIPETINENLPTECSDNGSKNTHLIDPKAMPQNFLAVRQKQARAVSPLSEEDEKFLVEHHTILASGNMKILEQMAEDDLITIANRCSQLIKYLFTMDGSTVEQVAVELETLAQVLDVRDIPSELGMAEYYAQLCPLPFPLMQEAFKRLKKDWEYRSFPTPAALTKKIRNEMDVIQGQHAQLQFVNRIVRHILENPKMYNRTVVNAVL